MVRSKKIRRILAAVTGAALLTGMAFSVVPVLAEETAAVETVEETAEAAEEAVETAEAPAEESTESNIQNILLIGQDRRPGEGRARSDSMILCSLDKTTNEITMVSFMRDLYVEIPGYGSTRINAAYAYGGMELLDQTIEQNFGVHIDNNIEVDFDGFVKIFDDLGGVDIELNSAEAAYLNKNGWSLTEGLNSLTGEQTLAYARTRYVGNSDWERTERQRRVLTAASKKIAGLGLKDIMTIANDVFSVLTTDMTSEELMALINTVVASGMNLAAESYRIPVDGTYTSERISGMAVLVPNLESNRQYLQQYLYN